DSRGRRHEYLVADNPAAGAPGGPPRGAQGLDVHHLAGAPRGRGHAPAGPHLVPDPVGRPPAQGRGGGRHPPRRGREKKLIEDAYTTGASLGLEVWCEDEAGPFQAVPHAGVSWRPEGDPERQPHEYVRGGTAKVLTLFRPSDGRVRVEGATTCPN